MNVVRSTRSFRGLGQLDPSSEPIFQDIMFGPDSGTTIDSGSDFPMYNDPGLTQAENVSAIQAAQGATSLVPSAGSAIASAIPQAVSNLTKGLAPGPSPRVAAPGFSSLFPTSSSSTWLLFAIAAAGLLLITAPSGRRR